MIKVSFDAKRNTVFVEFAGKVDVAQAEASYRDLQRAVRGKKNFKVLTDFSLLDEMGPVQRVIARSMDYLNQRGVTEILRVIPEPEKDLGFNILSAFHYSKDVKFLVFKSREEAEKRL